ncbi:MAG: DUF1801 domain-containing protein [Minisyncoccia bacterium]
MKKVKNIEDYIRLQPKKVASKLKIIHGIVKKLVPDVEEKISYGMPAYKLSGKILIYFSAHKNHIGLYPYPSAIKAFKKESVKYKTSTGTIQFQHSEKLPVPLITKIIKFRMSEIVTVKK